MCMDWTGTSAELTKNFRILAVTVPILGDLTYLRVPVPLSCVLMSRFRSQHEYINQSRTMFGNFSSEQNKKQRFI